LAEGALLAGLPAAPSAYSPFGPTPELAFIRQEEVLRRMVDDGYITTEQAEAAKQEVLKFRPNRVEIQAPHFVMYVRKLLAEKYGEDMITEGGLEVKTTLDLDLQNKTQEIVTAELEQLQRLRINNGAALVTNPETGEILAMVGSKDYFDFANDGQVNVTIRPRQPGSSIKPLTYATAFEHGKNPSTVEDDSPVVYQIPGSKPYAPKNYDGKFHGKVTLREALGSSYNIPAVKLLASLGLDTVINKGREMGITTWTDPTRYGLSLTLGGGEVLMIDMMKVYGTFATQGYTVETNPIMEITNYKGETLYRNECALDHVCAKKKTLDSRVAYYITDILKDNNARTPAFGPRSVLTIPGQEVAVKTGTTNNLKDNWTIGYTTNRVVATWVGNNDGSPMSYVASGVTGASPIWNDIMRLTLDDANPHTFAGPDGMIKVQICARTGTLSCRGCPAVRDEWFIPGTEPKTACNPAQFRPKPNPSASPAPNRDQILDGIFTN
jgi:membrane peptidoglycan carboxypeptidase